MNIIKKHTQFFKLKLNYNKKKKKIQILKLIVNKKMKKNINFNSPEK